MDANNSIIAKLGLEAESFSRGCKVVSVRDAFRVKTWLRKQTKPVAVWSKLLKRRVWIRPRGSDWAVLMKVIGRQEYGLCEEIGQPRFIVDAGANIGLSTLYFAWKYPSAAIVAVEPEPSNLELLRRNCENLSSVQIVPAALWSRHARVRIANPTEDNWAFSVAEAQGQEGNIPAVTVGELLQGSGQERIDILKVDIEGAEKQLFSEGWQAWLPRVGMILIELHDSVVPGCSQAFYSAILSRPFRQDLHGENVLIRFCSE